MTWICPTCDCVLVEAEEFYHPDDEGLRAKLIDNTFDILTRFRELDLDEGSLEDQLPDVETVREKEKF